MSSKRDTEAALKWIVKLLRKHGIAFQVTGGFAARVYGSTRPLRDIDIEISSAALKKIAKDVAPYIVYGPARYRDRHFIVPLITLEYRGQKIDLSASDDLRLYDCRTRKWVRYDTRLSSSAMKKVYGMRIPVATAEHLLSYKSMMNEKVQLRDIAAIEEAL